MSRFPGVGIFHIARVVDSVYMAGTSLRTFAVLILFFASTAQANLKIDKAYWENALREVSAACLSSQQMSASCLHGLDSLLPKLVGRGHYLLLREQLNEFWVPAEDASGQPSFAQGELVLGRLSPKGKERIEKIRISNFAAYMQFFRDLNRRYSNMALSGKLRAEDFTAAFRWVFERTRDDDHAESLFSDYVTAQYQELYGDPYFSFEARRPKVNLEPQLSMSLIDIEGRRIVTKVRPKSNADASGVEVGMTLDQIGEQKLTESNAQQLLARFAKKEEAAVFIAPSGQTKTVPPGDANPPFSGVHSYSFPFNGSLLGVIEIAHFSNGVCSHVETALNGFREQKLRGLIVDLRDNPGGVVAQAKCIGGLLFGQRHLLAQMRRLDPEVRTYTVTTDRDRTADKYPITFLINGGSASASEFLAGGAQDLGLAWLVGQRSFGKGVAQSRDQAHVGGQMVEGFDVVRTHFRFHFRSGVSPQVNGLTPDFLVASPVKGIDLESTVARMQDVYGRYFEASVAKIPVNAKREASKLKIKACVEKVEKRGQMAVSEEVTRWLQDRQLRKAAEVTMCAALISVNRR